MNILLVAGTRIVILALVFYSIAIITEQRKQIINNVVLTFITLGITFDIIATAFMIAGSNNSPFTLHGILGYSSLAAMLTDTVLMWRHRIRNGKSAQVAGGLHKYSRYAFTWWVLAFITGALLVVFK
jgi:hypothetical protein